MSARAAGDVRREQRRAAAARQRQRRPRHGEGGAGGGGGSGAGPAATAAAMAAVGERRSLPSPEAMLGQPWSHWVDAAKLHGNDGERTTAPPPHASRPSTGGRAWEEVPPSPPPYYPLLPNPGPDLLGSPSAARAEGSRWAAPSSPLPLPGTVLPSIPERRCPPGGSASGAGAVPGGCALSSGHFLFQELH